MPGGVLKKLSQFSGNPILYEHLTYEEFKPRVDLHNNRVQLYVHKSTTLLIKEKTIRRRVPAWRKHQAKLVSNSSTSVAKMICGVSLPEDNHIHTFKI